MIARLTIGVPFALAVPEGASYALYAYRDGDYEVVVQPPGASDQPLGMDAPSSLEVDGAKAFIANALRFDFHKAEFRRTLGEESLDPPEDVINRALASFVGRLRYVTRAPQIHRLTFPSGAWRLQYLNDDESELTQDPALFRVRTGRSARVALTALPPSIWESIHSLDPDWAPLVWDDLLLDAHDALPRIGTAVVLAATALEVFIAEILSALAASGDVPPDVWNWINTRGNSDWLTPSTEEQFDELLKHFTGHSLKEEERLWQLFKELKTARNKFVHEGVARVGGKPIGTERAAQLVAAAGEVIAQVRKWIPPHEKWPDVQVSAELRFILPLSSPVKQPQSGAS